MQTIITTTAEVTMLLQYQIIPLQYKMLLKKNTKNDMLSYRHTKYKLI